MKHRLLAVLLAVAMVMAIFAVTATAAAVEDVDPTPGVGTTYYYDSVNGNNNNSGTSPDSPKKDPGTQIWPAAGDTFAFKYGSSYNHGIEILGSGTEAAPITLTAYGDPAAGLPSFNGTEHTDVRDGGYGGAAIRIDNRSYITVEKLKLTHYNPADPDDWRKGPGMSAENGYYRRSGVWLIASTGYVSKGITIRDLEITRVMGMSITKENSKNQITMNDNIWVSQAHNAAILINQWDWSNEDAHFEDLLIENNYIHDVNVVGISMDGHERALGTGVVVRNNVINKTGADGIVMGRTWDLVVENNVVYNSSNPDNGLRDYFYTAGLWVWACDGNTIIQNNEVAYTRAMDLPGNTDAAAFDTDIASRGNYYWQYNYSHDNDGGFYFNMGQMDEFDPNGVNYLRYNISENDGNLGNSRAQMNLWDKSVLTNNVFYNALGSNHKLVANVKPGNISFLNNVFYMVGAGSDNTLINDNPDNVKFSNNALLGFAMPKADDGSNTIYTNGDDMGFVNIGTAGDAWSEQGGWNMIAAASGYKLKADSPLINGGRSTTSLIPEIEGFTNGGRDYFGNPVTGIPDIGAYESGEADDLTAPAGPTNLAAPIITDNAVLLTWEAKDADGIPMDSWIYRKAKSGGEFERIKYVVSANTYEDTGLVDETEYVYRVTTVSSAGVESETAAEVEIKTAIAAIIINADETVPDANGHFASSTGSWSEAGGMGSYENIYMVSDDASATFTWNANIKSEGYYNVYYWLPNGNQLRTRNAVLTVNHADGASTISLDQRNGYGAWVLISSYRFVPGMTTVTLENGASGLLNAGAIRMVYAGEDRDTSGISGVEMSIATTMLKKAETTAISVTAKDSMGRVFDVSTLVDAEIEYHYDATVITVKDGMIIASGEGATKLSATVTVGGKAYEIEPIVIHVGDDLALSDPMIGEGEDATAVTVPVSNFTGKDKQLTVIVAAYDANKTMLDYAVSETVIVKSMNSVTFTLELDAADADSVKVYVWNTVDGMDPVAGVLG